MCNCNNGYIEYWYSKESFDKMTAWQKLGWLKFEYENEYKELDKEDKRLFIQKGYTYCPTCKRAYQGEK